MKQDLILVGAGLGNGLLAYRLAELRPDLSCLVLESGPHPGADHTWSFHETDVSPDAARWIDPFVVHRWPDYDVVFPGHARRISTGYRTITADRFAEVLTERLGPNLRCGAEVAEIAPDGVLLRSGERIAARAVIDGRGPAESPALRLGYQLFLGQEVQLAAPHGIERPILMDATVTQHDGYRFVYVLPLSPDSLLVEDTYYSDAPDLDRVGLRSRIGDYIDRKGWRISATLREEVGVLPVMLGGDIARFWRDGAPDVGRSGLRAALAHPTTGYSLPDAVRVAEMVAGLPDLSAAPLAEALRSWSIGRWKAQGFFRMLNRMLFGAGSAHERYRILRHFYTMPEPIIRRFYAGDLTPLDKLRLLTGRPPVSVMGALKVLAPRSERRAA